MRIIRCIDDQKQFFGKLNNFQKSVKIKRWGNGKHSRTSRIDLISFLGTNIEEKKLLSYFITFENRYNLALYCLEEIRKECEVITELDTSQINELENKGNSVNGDLVIKTEYFINAINSCLDIISHIIVHMYNLKIKEKYVSFEKVYFSIKRKRDKFSMCFLKERKSWAKIFRDIRNRMIHHQIVNFSTEVEHDLQSKSLVLTKYNISVTNEKGDEIEKPLVKYFEETIKNFERFRSEFYKKLNSLT